MVFRCFAGSVSSAILVGVAVLLSGCADATSSATSTPSAVTAMKPVATLSDEELAAKIDEVVDFTQSRYMNAQDHAAWQIVHGILAYGYDLQIYVGDACMKLGELECARVHYLRALEAEDKHAAQRLRLLADRLESTSGARP